MFYWLSFSRLWSLSTLLTLPLPPYSPHQDCAVLIPYVFAFLHLGLHRLCVCVLCRVEAEYGESTCLRSSFSFFSPPFALNSSPYELVKNGLLSLYVTSLNIPAPLRNSCRAGQLTASLISFHFAVQVKHNSHRCCPRAVFTQTQMPELINVHIHNWYFVWKK